MLPGSLPLPKGASLAEAAMHPPRRARRRRRSSTCGTSARGGAAAFAPIAKVPSLMELNARASSPGGVKVAP